MADSTVHAVPACPDCGAEMRLRTARRGKNAGGQFWGCSRYPECKGTRDSQDTPAPVEEPLATVTRKVPWQDATINRPGWVARYSSVGGSLRSIGRVPSVDRRLSTCWVARQDRDAAIPADQQRLAVGVCQKHVQRGSMPALDPEGHCCVEGNRPHGGRVVRPNSTESRAASGPFTARDGEDLSPSDASDRASRLNATVPSRVSGVTSQPDRLGRGSAAAGAPSRVRSLSLSVGRSICRRRTVSWWRNTTISRSLERPERTAIRARAAMRR
jgi:ssDNA-binding Zn-finger/Zn-ribbon topoisomerase 1